MTWTFQRTPKARLRPLNAHAVQDGAYVLYWMTSARRTTANFGLQYAMEQANALNKPLVVLEPLRVDYEYAADRFHHFILDGMRDNAEAFEPTAIRYIPYAERAKGQSKGMLQAYARHACLVVTDDYPCFFLPKMLKAAGEQLDTHLVAVDSNGLLPMQQPERAFTTAYAFRRYLQKVLPELLFEFPILQPLEMGVPAQTQASMQVLQDVLERWPALDSNEFEDRSWIADLPIHHGVQRVDTMPGGAKAARARLQAFVPKLKGYDKDRNAPSKDGSSGFSPYLHFGHLGSHEAVHYVLEKEGWNPTHITDVRNGQRQGFWNCREGTEAFLDQIITWRELGFNFCFYEPNYLEFETLPDWAKTTLREHADDERYTYTLEELERCQTNDDVWNAAQNQLMQEGNIHNYLRMVWGKLILQWSESPEQALERMIYLNDKYALDGRDPNSYTGVCWVLGRFDRAWGPERPIFGKVRYMTTRSTRAKFDLGPYLAKWTPRPEKRIFE